MNKDILKQTVKEMLAPGKGLLAMDESTGTCNKRFAALGIPQTEEYRRIFREWIVTAPGLNESISGAILFDETIRQKTKEGKSFVKILEDAGIVPGIKVDEGTIDLAGFSGESITEGLDGLKERLQKYKQLGARFAKWRVVITIGKNIPTRTGIYANAQVLARYASICQQEDIVPIVEPEVLMEGDHTIEQCYAITRWMLLALFGELNKFRVYHEGMLLKPNMILPGKEGPQVTTAEVASLTVNCLRESVPAAIPGIVFLSGGQSSQQASEHLNAINKNYKDKLPWIVTFSFSRAIEHPAIDIWHGEEKNIPAAQESLAYRARCNSAARKGEYTKEMEKES